MLGDEKYKGWKYKWISVWKIYLHDDNEAKLKNQKQWELAGWRRENIVKVFIQQTRKDKRTAQS